MRFTAIIMLSIAVITACSPQRKFDRLIRRYPQLLSQQIDTIKDTIIIRQQRLDTLLLLNKQHDTIVIDSSRIRVELIKIRDTLRLKAICKGDTIYKTKVVQKYKYVSSCNTNEKWLYILIGFVVALLIVVFASR